MTSAGHARCEDCRLVLELEDRDMFADAVFCPVCLVRVEPLTDERLAELRSLSDSWRLFRRPSRVFA